MDNHLYLLHRYWTAAVLAVLLLSGNCFQCAKCDRFAFASYYGDHMVLQRGPQQAILWGYGPKPGHNVTVLLNGETPITVKVDIGNTWKVKLPAVTDTKPHTITAMSSAGTIMLNDVLFGDVWICSGQSNMQFTMAMLGAWRNDSTNTAGFPDIRWHQTADYGYVPNDKMPKVFMATAMDLPDDSSPYDSIHPRDKQDVADRLLLPALAVAYNKPGIKYQGPLPIRYLMDTIKKTFLITYDDSLDWIEVMTLDGFDVFINHKSFY